MDFSAALPTFIITLREGVEAALVVGIVMAYLKKAKQTQLTPWVYGGIGVGIAVSGMIGMFFSWLVQSLSSANQKYAPVIEPLLEGIFSLLAIAMLTWMLLWMTKQAKQMRTQVENQLGSAIKGTNNRGGWGVFMLIFLAVLREGFETVLFIAAKFQEGVIPALGATLGIATAWAIGVMLFRWGIKLNIRLFFQVMGLFLLLLVSGLLVTALGNFDTAIHALSQLDRQSEGLCFYYERFAQPGDKDCILGPMIWNLSKILPDDQFPGLILRALLGYTQRLYFIQALFYGIFLITIGGLYYQSISGKVILPLKKWQQSSQKRS